MSFSESTLGMMTLGMSGLAQGDEHIGTGALTLAAATVAGTGAETFTATGALTLASVTVSGSGAETISGTGALTLAALTVSGTGAEAISGTGALSLASVTVAGTGAETFTGTGALTLAAITVAGNDTAQSGYPGSGRGFSSPLTGTASVDRLSGSATSGPGRLSN